jgi:hypothetical protein
MGDAGSVYTALAHYGLLLKQDKVIAGASDGETRRTACLASLADTQIR